MKTIPLVLIILFLTFSVVFVSAMDITFFYSDGCPYCQQIKPTIISYSNSDNNNWNLLETSIPKNQELFKNYNFDGVPAFVINTDDGRTIKFVGANIKKLNCELQEMSTKDCPTYSANSCMGESWFLN